MSWVLSDEGILFPDGTLLQSGFFSRADNPIINGAMEVDQANNGAAVTVNAAIIAYSVDMFIGFGAASAGVFSLQQMADTPPSGFKNYLRAKVTTADANPAAGSIYALQHSIEGVNLARFSFGSALAKTITLPFMVRSSVAGTFSGSIRNGATNRSYPFQYTIQAGQVNTWIPLRITLTGDTTGTWAKDTSVGCYLVFDLGCGATYQSSSPDTWNVGNYMATAGSTQLIKTLNATLDITGLDLVEGTTGRPYPHRTDELLRCQRYLPCWRHGGSGAEDIGFANFAATNGGTAIFKFPVPTRVPPTGINGSVISTFSATSPTVSSVLETLSFSSAGIHSGRCNFSVAGAPYTAGHTGSLFLTAEGVLLFSGARL